jgi:LysR family transcriptional regulator, glycine cleavage system transcriptional activator
MRGDQTAVRRLMASLSLDALRGFEASARRSSFTAAAEELCITQSAVSKQVKMLEEAFGRPLFVRGPRGLGLTPEGRQLYEAVRKVISGLERTFEQILTSARKSVALTVTPSFASLWLAPKLVAFHAQHPSLDVRVDDSENCVVLEREGIDLAVRLTRPGHAESTWKPLIRERVMLVAAPELAARANCPEDLTRLPRLVFQHPVERFEWMSWSHWYERLNLPRSSEQPVFQFSQYEHVVKAAIEGAGVAIGRAPLVLPALRAGRLQVVVPQVQGDGFEYHLVTSEATSGRPEVDAVAEWITSELIADALS